jgi:hypothetical protein
MPTTIFDGKRIREVELLDVFPASEGVIDQYYGRIGCGKTYAATCDALELLRRGKVVYANWDIDYRGYDERASKFRLFVSLIFPWIRRFYFFPKENLHYFEFSDEWAIKKGFKDWADWFSHLTDCDIFADEGHLIFDSYTATRMSMEKRASILHTRHFNRSIHIISQRPTAVHVAMRANVNVFYRCEKIFQWGKIVRFKKTEFQDMANENVDENPDLEIGRRYYWGKQRIFEAYDTKYLRRGMKSSQKVMFEAYDYGYIARCALFFRQFFPQKIKEPVPIKLMPHTEKNKIVKLKLLHINNEVVKWWYNSKIGKMVYLSKNKKSKTCPSQT